MYDHYRLDFCTHVAPYALTKQAGSNVFSLDEEKHGLE